MGSLFRIGANIPLELIPSLISLLFSAFSDWDKQNKNRTKKVFIFYSKLNKDFLLKY
jgi:hypothetical protein